MDKTYQIFVGSTSADLADERRAVMARLLDLGHIPVGIDGFDPADATQWRSIEKRIDTSDYVLRVAAEREDADRTGALCALPRDYDHALLQGIPVVTLRLDPTMQDNSRQGDVEGGTGEATEDVGHRLWCWTTIEDLADAAEAALSHLLREEPRRGWVRGKAIRTDVAQAQTKAAEAPSSPLEQPGLAVGPEVQAMSKALEAVALEIGAFEHNQYVQKALTLLDIFFNTYYSFLSGLSATDFLCLILEIYNGRVIKPDENKILNALMAHGLIEARLSLKPTSGRTMSTTMYFLSAGGQDFAAHIRTLRANEIMDRYYSPESD